MFDREKVIDILINDDLDIQYSDMSHLEYMLFNGFIGYDNMTDDELIKECEERDISYLVGDNDDE